MIECHVKIYFTNAAFCTTFFNPGLNFSFDFDILPLLVNLSITPR